MPFKLPDKYLFRYLKAKSHLISRLLIYIYYALHSLKVNKDVIMTLWTCLCVRERDRREHLQLRTRPILKTLAEGIIFLFFVSKCVTHRRRHRRPNRVYIFLISIDCRVDIVMSVSPDAKSRSFVMKFLHTSLILLQSYIFGNVLCQYLIKICNNLKAILGYRASVGRALSTRVHKLIFFSPKFK